MLVSGFWHKLCGAVAIGIALYTLIADNEDPAWIPVAIIVAGLGLLIAPN